VKIDQHDAPNRAGEKPLVAPTASGRRVSGSVGRQGSRPAAPLPKDNLDLSAGAEEFQRLRSRLDGLADPAREARVAELGDRIARGAYAIDAERVAEAMLRDETVIHRLA
jgi:flagellar biosynthesis anti-sigma factor FlgM